MTGLYVIGGALGIILAHWILLLLDKHKTLAIILSIIGIIILIFVFPPIFLWTLDNIIKPIGIVIGIVILCMLFAPASSADSYLNKY